MLKRAVQITLIGASVGFSGLVLAEEDRSAVLERIKPVGMVNVEGAPKIEIKDATPAPVAEAAAPAMEAPAAAAETVAAVSEMAAPAAEAAAPAAVDGQAIYTTACFACHGTGAAGAPKLGDKAAWAARVATGKDALLASAINGKGAMPPKGGQMHLSEAEISASIDYILDSVK